MPIKAGQAFQQSNSDRETKPQKGRGLLARSGFGYRAARTTASAHLVPGISGFAIIGVLTRQNPKARARKTGRNSQNSGRQADLRLGRRRLRNGLHIGLHRRLRRLHQLILGLILGMLSVLGMLIVVLRLMALTLPRILGLVLVLIVARGLVAALIGPILALAITLTIEVLAVVTAAIVAPIITRVAALAVALIGTLVALLPLWLAVLLLEFSVQNAIIVIGVLKIVLGENAVTRRAGIARHGEKFFHQLLGIAPHPPVIAAVEVRIASAATATTAAAAAWARLTAVAAALTALHIIVLFIHQSEWTF